MASVVRVLKDYFGMKPGQSLMQFNDELKALTPDEKQYLAEGAARELGVALDAPVQGSTAAQQAALSNAAA